MPSVRQPPIEFVRDCLYVRACVFVCSTRECIFVCTACGSERARVGAGDGARAAATTVSGPQRRRILSARAAERSCCAAVRMCKQLGSASWFVCLRVRSVVVDMPSARSRPKSAAPGSGRRTAAAPTIASEGRASVRAFAFAGRPSVCVCAFARRFFEWCGGCRGRSRVAAPLVVVVVVRRRRRRDGSGRRRCCCRRRGCYHCACLRPASALSNQPEQSSLCLTSRFTVGSV